ncbi:hypothetical protein ACFL01_04500, partial [Planctomycetota bacterium]
SLITIRPPDPSPMDEIICWCLVAALGSVTVQGEGPSIYVPPPRGQEEETKAEGDVVILSNSDRLSGEVLGTDDKGNLLMKHPLLGMEVVVPISAAKSIGFAGTSEKLVAGRDSVTATNGDSFTGKIRSLKGDELIMDSGYAGTITLNRRMISSIGLGSGGRIVISDDFSEGMLGWIPHGGSWKVKNDALYQGEYGSYYVSRRIDQSGPMTYEWEMSSGSSNQINAGAAIFCSGTGSMYGDDSYYVFVQGNSIYLYRVRNHSTRSVANKYLRRSVPSAKCRLEYDPDSGKLAFTVNGEEVCSYTDPSPLKKGSHFLLCASQPTSFDDIRVIKGRGTLTARSEGGEDRDVVFFTNGDRTSGVIQTISDGKMVMKTSFGSINVELENAGFIEFGKKSMEEPRKRAGDARIVLTNHDRLTVDIKSIDAGELKGYMDSTGDIAIKRSAILRMKFHLYD